MALCEGLAHTDFSCSLKRADKCLLCQLLEISMQQIQMINDAPQSIALHTWNQLGLEISNDVTLQVA